MKHSRIIIFAITLIMVAISAYATDISSCQVIDSPGSYDVTTDLGGVITGAEECINITATSFTPASGYGPMGDPLSGGSGGQAGIPEFNTWTLLIGLMIIIGGFFAVRQKT